MNEPDLLITHGPSCRDGFGAAWAVRQRWPTVEVIFAAHGDTPPDVTDRRVLMADFCYPMEIMQELGQAAAWLHVVDHHQTAQPILKTLSTGPYKCLSSTFDLNRSGAVLAWHYAWGDGRPVPMLLQYVQDRDLWRHEMENTHEIAALLGVTPLDHAEWTALAKRLEDPGQRAAPVREGRAILRSRQAQIDALLASCVQRQDVEGINVPVVNAPFFLASDLGEALSAGEAFVAIYWDDNEGFRHFSLRSAPDGMDVAEIAEKNGGGGHKHAAGFRIRWDYADPGDPPVDAIPLNPTAKPIKGDS